MPGSAKTYLDPRAPLVIDTRDLSRRAGSLRRTRFTVPAPPALGTALVSVPDGAELELDLRLEAVMEGILVSGAARAPLAGECSRCLDPLQDKVEVDLQQLFVYPDLHGDPTVAVEDDLGQLVDDRLDLEPLVRDAVVLALPISPRCREDCPGLCASCGERLADLPPEHAHAVADGRWAALTGFEGGGPDGVHGGGENLEDESSAGGERDNGHADGGLRHNGAGSHYDRRSSPVPDQES